MKVSNPEACYRTYDVQQLKDTASFYSTETITLSTRYDVYWYRLARVTRFYSKGRFILFQTPIRHSADPVEHGLYVWDTYISQCAALDIVVVAQSFGGVVVSAIAHQRVSPSFVWVFFHHDHFPDEAFVLNVKFQFSDFSGRVRGIAFTDSLHHPTTFAYLTCPCPQASGYNYS
jgi:hypothetical protein